MTQPTAETVAVAGDSRAFRGAARQGTGRENREQNDG